MPKDLQRIVKEYRDGKYAYTPCVTEQMKVPPQQQHDDEWTTVSKSKVKKAVGGAGKKASTTTPHQKDNDGLPGWG